MSDHNHAHGNGHNHDHDHEHEHEHEEEIFLVTDEAGEEHEMVIVYTFESQDKGYAVLLDRNDPDADGVIFRIEEENDEAFLIGIEDEEEWNRVAQIYNEIVAQEENA